MTHAKKRLVTMAVLVGACASTGLAQSTGPDVIVGDLPSTRYWGTVGGINGYSVATTSCNIGTQPLAWQSGTINHPVIPQSMYRLKDGRFTQVGQSWLKHAFATVNNGICGTCSGPTGSQLYPGCSDPYGSGLNGDQGNLGPKFEVNAATGAYNANFFADGQTGNAIYKRLQVARADIDVTPTDTRYFVESQYITADDAMANNGRNNASWQEVRFSSLSSNPTNVGSTMREEPAILAWQAFDGSVELIPVDYSENGITCRFWVGAKVVNNNDGTWTYTYAVQNLNSDRSAQAFVVPLGGANLITDVSFTDVDYHSGEPYSGTDWSFTQNDFDAEWSTQTFATNVNANALRWGTLYSFQFTANSGPVDANGAIKLFKPGGPAQVTIPNLPSPDTAGPLPLGMFADAAPPALVAPGDDFVVSVKIDPRDDVLVASSERLYFRKDGGAFASTTLTPIGSDIYMGTIPSSLCGQSPEWYFQAEGVEAGVVTYPAGGASSALSTVIGQDEDAFTDDATTDKGWTVGAPGDTATSGAWVRAASVPTIAQPEGGVGGLADLCFVTGNANPGDPDGTNDIDGGFTTLITPVIDLAGGEPATSVSVFIWFDNSQGLGPNEDPFVVDISNDNGANWSNALTIAANSPDSNGGWVRHVFNPSDFVSLTDQVRLRFVATDAGQGSLVEAAVDLLSVNYVGCANPPACAADWNADGTLNDQDFFDWTNDYFSQTGPQGQADFNNDGFQNDQDWFDFSNAYFGGC